MFFGKGITYLTTFVGGAIVDKDYFCPGRILLYNALNTIIKIVLYVVDGYNDAEKNVLAGIRQIKAGVFWFVLQI